MQLCLALHLRSWFLMPVSLSNLPLRKVRSRAMLQLKCRTTQML